MYKSKQVLSLLWFTSIKYVFSNNQCLLVIFAKALLLLFHPLINFNSPYMQYRKQVHLHMAPVVQNVLSVQRK